MSNQAETCAEWGLIGPGNIGGELLRQVGQPYVAERLGLSPVPSFVLRSSGLYLADGITEHPAGSLDRIEELPEVTFIAMPTTDDGEEARAHIHTILDQGKLAVTAEKGALANFYQEMHDASDGFTNLGINASVGGGTRMLNVAPNYTLDTENITQMHLVLNGTLAAIMSYIGPADGSGMSLGQAVRQSVTLGYAEPGSDSPYDVIRGEAEGDIPKKTAILFNHLGLGDSILNWNDLKFELTDEEISQAIAEAIVRRFVVSIYSEKFLSRIGIDPSEDVIGGFNSEFEGWKLVGGFQNTHRNPLFSALARITGPGAGAVIGLGPDETDGAYIFAGPGAGLGPTVNAMLDDYIARARK